MSTSRSSSKRWTSAGEAARILRQKFMSGELDPNNLNAEDVYNSHDSFMQYDGKAFRANLTRLAQSIIDAGGIQAWSRMNKELLEKDKARFHNAFSKKKPSVIYTSVPDNKKPPPESPPEFNFEQSNEVILSLPHIMSQFDDIRGNRRISLKILLLSGSSASTLKVKVVRSGLAVLVEAKFPKSFIAVPHHIQNLRNMTGNRIHFSETDGRITAFHSAVSRLQQNGSSDDIWGKMTIHLPFECEQQFFNDVVPPIDLGCYEDIQILSLELMGVRTNFVQQFEGISMRRAGFQQSNYQHHQATENNQNAHNTKSSSSAKFGGHATGGDAFVGGGMDFSLGDQFSHYRSAKMDMSSSATKSRTLGTDSTRSEDEEVLGSSSIPKSITTRSSKPHLSRSVGSARSSKASMLASSLAGVSEKTPPFEQMHFDQQARHNVGPMQSNKKEFIPSPEEIDKDQEELYEEEMHNIVIENILRNNEIMFAAAEQDEHFQESESGLDEYDQLENPDAVSYDFATDCPNAEQFINQCKTSTQVKAKSRKLVRASPAKRSTDSFALSSPGKRQKLKHTVNRRPQPQEYDESPRNVSHDSRELEENSLKGYVV